MLLSVLAVTCSLGGAPIPLEAMMEAPLVPGAVALDEPGRYRSPRSFDDTLDFYSKLFNQGGVIRWRNIVNLPGIKAKHLECLRRKTRWEGINVYEYKGEVRLYVIARDAKRRGSAPDIDTD
jgi:hypothetical protein